MKWLFRAADIQIWVRRYLRGEALMNVGSVRDNNEKSEMSVITEGAVSHWPWAWQASPRGGTGSAQNALVSALSKSGIIFLLFSASKIREQLTVHTYAVHPWEINQKTMGGGCYYIPVGVFYLHRCTVFVCMWHKTPKQCRSFPTTPSIITQV